MQRWVRYLQNSLDKQVDPDLQARLLQAPMPEGADGISDSLNPVKSAAWAHEIIGRMENCLDEPARVSILEACGGQCISAALLAKARKIRQKSYSLEEFLAVLNQNHIGGGALAWRDGAIDASYPRCYCGMVSQTREPFSATYCNCSRGWFLSLFVNSLGVPVRVDLVQSIIQGAPDCRFRIYLPQYFAW